MAELLTLGRRFDSSPVHVSIVLEQLSPDSIGAQESELRVGSVPRLMP